MILTLTDSDSYPPALRALFTELQSQIAQQWQQAHTPAGRPLARILQAFSTTTQPIPNNVWTAVTFNAEADVRTVPGVTVPVGVHSQTVRTDRFYITSALAGWVDVRARFTLEANATGIRGARLLLNGAAQPGSTTIENNVTAASKVFPHVDWSGPVASGDEITFEVFQNSGGTIYTGEVVAEAYNVVTVEFR